MSHRRLGAPGGRRPASRSVGAASERQHRVTVELRLGTSLTIKMCRPDPDHCPRRDEGEEQTVKTQDDMKLSTESHEPMQSHGHRPCQVPRGHPGPAAPGAGRGEGQTPAVEPGHGVRLRPSPWGQVFLRRGEACQSLLFRPEFPPRSTVSSSKRFGETQRGGTCGAPI